MSIFDEEGRFESLLPSIRQGKHLIRLTLWIELYSANAYHSSVNVLRYASERRSSLSVLTRKWL
jgi:hypothetical protein